MKKEHSTDTHLNDIQNANENSLKQKKNAPSMNASTTTSSSEEEESEVLNNDLSLLNQGLLLENMKLKNEIKSLQKKLMTVEQGKDQSPIRQECLKNQDYLERDSLRSNYPSECKQTINTNYSILSFRQRKNISNMNEVNVSNNKREVSKKNKKKLIQSKDSNDESDPPFHDYPNLSMRDEENANLLPIPTEAAVSFDSNHSPQIIRNEITGTHQIGYPQHQEHHNHASKFYEEAKDRGGWLVGLLILQSMSSFILEYNEKLLKKHIIIVNFLTMLVGAGGNAGNQASVRVIRGLAVGTLNDKTRKSFLINELKMILFLSMMLGIVGLIRALLFQTPVPETIAITGSLIMIVGISIGLGTFLPFGMRFCGIDPAHSSTTIQVIMDILGVTITCQVCRLVLNEDWWHTKYH